ncbi:hypothetical protein RYX36_032008, partial [Vicia faba]
SSLRKASRHLYIDSCILLEKNWGLKTSDNEPSRFLSYFLSILSDHTTLWQ